MMSFVVRLARLLGLRGEVRVSSGGGSGEVSDNFGAMASIVKQLFSGHGSNSK